VYACGAKYAEAESVGTTADGVQIYGGLECPVAGDGGVADAGDVDSSTGPWSYTGTKAQVVPATTEYALDVEGLVTGAHFEDLAFVALSATQTAYGTSSIAVMVNGSANVSFLRVSAKAGDGAPGAPGATVATSNYCDTSGQGGSASSGGAGGNNGSCTCIVLGSSLGGAGGDELGVGDADGGTGSSTPATIEGADRPPSAERAGVPAVVEATVLVAAEVEA
jgi:hypothetical protein